jgi:hypothetical protein
MTWIVTWAFGTDAEIEAVAAARGDRVAVDEEVQWVDRTLRRYPLDLGEGRYPGDRNYRPVTYRVWFGDTIGVFYRVDVPTKTVQVQSVGPARRPR